MNYQSFIERRYVWKRDGYKNHVQLSVIYVIILFTLLMNINWK